MYKGDTIPGLLFVALGTVFMVPGFSLGFATSTSDGVPGAGFFPILMGAVIIILGIILLIKGIKENGKTVYFALEEDQKGNIATLFITIGSLLVFFLLWKFIRFEIAAFVFCLFLNWIFKRSWKFNLVFSAAFIAMVYCIFSLGLKIQFVV